MELVEEQILWNGEKVKGWKEKNEGERMERIWAFVSHWMYNAKIEEIKKKIEYPWRMIK